jgi:hypothetical protein
MRVWPVWSRVKNASPIVSKKGIGNVFQYAGTVLTSAHCVQGLMQGDPLTGRGSTPCVQKSAMPAL